VGLREAHEQHLPQSTLAVLRSRQRLDLPALVGKRGAELFYRVGVLKRWVSNRPCAAVGTTDLE
jgi:hypothetical protein